MCSKISMTVFHNVYRKTVTAAVFIAYKNGRFLADLPFSVTILYPLHAHLKYFKHIFFS